MLTVRITRVRVPRARLTALRTTTKGEALLTNISSAAPILAFAFSRKKHLLRSSMSSYDSLKEPTNGPPTYVAQYPSGYQMNEYSPAPGTATTHIPPENTPVPRVRRQEQEEREQTPAEDDEYVPASIPVAHLNVSKIYCTQ